MYRFFLLFAAAALLVAQTPQEKALLSSIHAAPLRAHVSFLASDLLEGRDTPSRGLEIAAEYIASRLRALGLEPAGGDGYFQIADFATVTQPTEGFELTATVNGTPYTVTRNQASLVAGAVREVTGAPIFKVNLAEPESIEALKAEQIAGKVVYAALPDLASFTGADRQRGIQALLRSRNAVLRLKPAMMITQTFGPGGGGGQRLREAGATAPPQVSTVNLGNQELLAALRALPDGETPATITAKLPAATEEPVKLKNVIAVLRGSDPLLKDTYVLVTAHYDHIGLSRSQAADNINNGANDDASGVACMLELAAAFSGLAERPRRSIVFMAYFGEERGLLGSRYYTRNPVFPLAKTVANLNLEHMGRTDDTEGSTEGKLTATGFDYSSVVEVLQQAGEAVGLKVYKHDTNSDSFFGRSDNQALADAGVPAHTILACYIFPDYHRPGDHWDKLDYDNMAQLNRAAGLATLRLANSATAPRWNEANPKAAKYLEAWKQLQSNH